MTPPGSVEYEHSQCGLEGQRGPEEFCLLHPSGPPPSPPGEGPPVPEHGHDMPADTH